MERSNSNRASGFDLHKYEGLRVLVPTDEVHLSSVWCPIIAVKDFIAQLAQMPGGEPFTAPAQPSLRVFGGFSRRAEALAAPGEKFCDELGKGHAD